MFDRLVRFLMSVKLMNKKNKDMITVNRLYQVEVCLPSTVEITSEPVLIREKVYLFGTSAGITLW